LEPQNSPPATHNPRTQNITVLIGLWSFGPGCQTKINQNKLKRTKNNRKLIRKANKFKIHQKITQFKRNTGALIWKIVGPYN